MVERYPRGDLMDDELRGRTWTVEIYEQRRRSVGARAAGPGLIPAPALTSWRQSHGARIVRGVAALGGFLSGRDVRPLAFDDTRGGGLTCGADQWDERYGGGELFVWKSAPPSFSSRNCQPSSGERRRSGMR